MDDGRTLGPVDERVGHRGAPEKTQRGERGEGSGKQEEGQKRRGEAGDGGTGDGERGNFVE
ncbi:hypothetical protein GCM10010317_044800 [Streptomyces mirabilis]|nr:hypothetical protein GCM10010317_044800 [Streptomyces mirabilis]